MRRHHGIQLAAITVAITLAGATTARAATQIEEVIVTAQKRSQDINDVGITINAFTGDRLKQMGVNSAQDVALHTPGLTVNESFSLGVPIYTIRGVGFQDYNIGASSTVGLYFDEVSYPYSVMTRGAIFDIERVEVLKGPQGDLYGRNTTAGSINFISKRPTDEFEAGFTTSYGRYETFSLEGYVGGPLTDAAQGRLAFKTVNSSKGWQKSLSRNDELGEQDMGAARGMLNLDLSEDATLLLKAHIVKDEGENSASTAYDGREFGLNEFNLPYRPLNLYRIPGNATFGQTPPWYSTDDNETADWTNTTTTRRNGFLEEVDIRPQRDNEMKGVMARLDWEIGEVTFTSITAYDEFERVEAFDADGGAFVDSGNINTSEIEVFSQELRLAGKTDRIEWIAGLFYSDDSVSEWYNYYMSDSLFGNGSVVWGIPPFQFAPILELDTIYSQDTESYAAFGHVEYAFADRWRLTLGLRYTEEERDWEGCTYDTGDGSLSGFLNFAFGVSLAPGNCGTVNDVPTSPFNFFTLLTTGGNPNLAFQPYEDTIKTEKWQWKAGIDYQLSDDALAYLSVSTGFKSGGFNGANSNAQSQLIPYRAEELTSYELGVKATLLEGAMQLNASAFYYDYQDKQEQDIAVTFVGNIGGLTNVPESEVKGVELELRWLPLEGLSVDAGVAWLDTEVTEWDAVDPASVWLPDGSGLRFVDASGIELAMAPEWQFNSTIAYEWSLGDALVMGVAGDISYKDSTTARLAEQAVEDYTVMNARIFLASEDGKWRTTLWSNNVADEDYYLAGYAANGPFGRVMAMPRTYGLTLDYAF
ncbi:MAG: TonB-dependent receptor [Gammaproteobacteria bacterium]